MVFFAAENLKIEGWVVGVWGVGASGWDPFSRVNTLVGLG